MPDGDVRECMPTVANAKPGHTDHEWLESCGATGNTREHSGEGWWGLMEGGCSEDWRG